MTDTRYKIVSSNAASAHILESHGAYHAFFGAGLSAEAEVLTANQICDFVATTQLRLEGLKTDIPFEPASRAWLAANLDWDRPDEKYAKCIRTQYVNPADRVDYFRRILERSRPSFAHHGAAILMSEGILARNCLTTNFDKLLEQAFATQGGLECQVLRTASEVKFWRPDPQRCFCIKLHGDYDTHNVLNTSEETVRIDDTLRKQAGRLLEHTGLVALGLAGYEKSVYSFFEDLTTEAGQNGGALDRGLLWGVYVGDKPAERWTMARTTEEVQKAIANGAVGPEIVKMMNRMASSDVQFAFFPVFGCGQFFVDLIEQSERRAVIRRAEPLLDHELRLRRVFGRAKLSPARIDEHLRKLKETKTAVAKSSGPSSIVERAFAFHGGGRELSVAYGDITSRSYLGQQAFSSNVRAVISPDDTFLSVGGGVAFSLAEKAGLRSMLHEVSKFVPVPQGESRVTSAGLLPIHYVIHSATIEVSDTGYQVTADDVRRTFIDALRKAVALGVEVLSVPLLGAGVAGFSARDSFKSLVEAYHAEAPAGVPPIVVLVVFKESQLSRADARATVNEILDGASATWSDEPWPNA